MFQPRSRPSRRHTRAQAIHARLLHISQAIRRRTGHLKSIRIRRTSRKSRQGQIGKVGRQSNSFTQGWAAKSQQGPRREGHAYGRERGEEACEEGGACGGGRRRGGDSWQGGWQGRQYSQRPAVQSDLCRPRVPGRRAESRVWYAQPGNRYCQCCEFLPRSDISDLS